MHLHGCNLTRYGRRGDNIQTLSKIIWKELALNLFKGSLKEAPYSFENIHYCCQWQREAVAYMQWCKRTMIGLFCDQFPALSLSLIIPYCVLDLKILGIKC